MDVHLDITDDRDVYVEEDNNMEVEKEVEKEVDEEVDKDVPIFVMHWYVSYWKQQKTQFVFHFQKDWLAIATLKPTFTFLVVILPSKSIEYGKIPTKESESSF